MKKIFLALLMVASLSVSGYSRDVRVVLKNGLERKGELTATNEDSVFVKFKNGKVRKIPFTEITSVLDVKTKADIFATIQAEGKVPAEETPAAAAATAAPEAADGAAQKPTVRVVMKTGLERKGILTATNEDSVFIKFKNGKVRKILFAEIASVIDTQANKDILSSIQAESKTEAEAPAADETSAAEATPAAVKEPVAVKASAAEKGPALLDVTGSFTPTAPTASKQKGLPDNLMGWMSARYGSKTMLGLKWENPNKAKTQYVAENNAALAYALANPGMQAGGPRRRSGAAVKGPAASLDIAFTASFLSGAYIDPVVNSYVDVKYRQNAKPGGFTSWSINYLKYSVNEEVWDNVAGGYLPQTTEASVLSATFVLAMPSAFSIYGFAGPAMVSYDCAKHAATYFDWSSLSYVATPAATTSGSATTWIAGMGYALKFPKSGFGLFAELKYVPETGTFPGFTNFGGGLTFGF